MPRLLFRILLLLPVVTLLPAGNALMAEPERKTIFVAPMDGFDRLIIDALKRHEVSANIVSESEHPEWKVDLGKRIPSGYAEILYESKLGRKNESVLRVVEVATGKTIARFEFLMPGGDNARQQVAGDFAEHLRKKLIALK